MSVVRQASGIARRQFPSRWFGTQAVRKVRIHVPDTGRGMAKHDEKSARRIFLFRVDGRVVSALHSRRNHRSRESLAGRFLRGLGWVYLVCAFLAAKAAEGQKIGRAVSFTFHAARLDILESRDGNIRDLVAQQLSEPLGVLKRRTRP